MSLLQKQEEVINPHLKYRPDIDGLRAIAVLLVVGYHVYPRYVPGGFIGVDIFFVISGYLISSLIFKALVQGDFSFSDFYARRIKRIFPALTFVLVVVLGLGWFVLFPFEYARLGQHTVSAVGFFTNFVLWNEAGYFDTAALSKPLLHLWSLGIEEQFYIVWPVLIWALFKRTNIAIVITAILTVSLLANIYMVRGWPEATFYMPFTRFWELLIGSLLAHKMTSLQAIMGAQKVIYAELLSIAAAVFIFAGLLLINSDQAYPGYWALLPTLGAACFIAAGSHTWINKKVLGSHLFVFFGLISFPLYLWHWPMVAFRNILHLNISVNADRLFKVMIVLFSILLAYLTYRYIELPIRSRRGGAKTLSLTLLLVGTFALFTYKDGGWTNRFDQDITRQLDTFLWAEKGLDAQPSCLHDFKRLNLDFCLRADSSKPPTAIIIGDSHSNSLFYGLSKQLAEQGQNLINLGRGACIPFYDLESRYVTGRDMCVTAMNGALNYAIESKSIKTIFLVSRGTTYITGKSFGDMENVWDKHIIHKIGDDSADFSHIYANAMNETLNRLAAAHKDVVFVIDWPEIGFDPADCSPVDLRRVHIDTRLPVKSECTVSRSAVDDWNRLYRETIRPVLAKYPDVKVFDPTDILCNRTECRVIFDGKILYRDDNHLSLDGSQYIGSRYSINDIADTKRNGL